MRVFNKAEVFSRFNHTLLPEFLKGEILHICSECELSGEHIITLRKRSAVF
jgi:hypothetical protein